MSKKLLIFIPMLVIPTLRSMELPDTEQKMILEHLSSEDIKSFSHVNKRARDVSKEVRAAYKEKLSTPEIELKTENFDDIVNEFVKLHKMREVDGFGNFCTQRYNDLKLFIFKTLRDELCNKLSGAGADADAKKFDFITKFGINPDLFRNKTTESSVYGDGLTLLFLAVETKNFEIFEKLLQAGANPNIINGENGAALNAAILSYAYDKRFVEKLLQFGANVNSARESDGSAPLHVAADVGNSELVSILLQAGADVKAIDGRKGTPLHIAAEMGHPELVSILLQAGADVKAEAERNETPLHWAMDYAQKGTGSLLLQAGADVNAMDEEGETPLHSVILALSDETEEQGIDDIKDCLESIEMLLTYNPDLSIQDENGETPLDLSTRLENSADTAEATKAALQKVIKLLTEKSEK